MLQVGLLITKTSDQELQPPTASNNLRPGIALIFYYKTIAKLPAPYRLREGNANFREEKKRRIICSLEKRAGIAPTSVGGRLPDPPAFCFLDFH